MKRLYTGGNILTLLSEDDRVEALVIEDGKIIDKGSRADMTARHGDAEIIDLKGQTLMPSFIDPHSHITSTAESLMMCSLEGTSSIEEILERLKLYIKTTEKKPGDFVIGVGYDNNRLPGRIHPTAGDLEELKGYNVAVAHASGHMGVLSYSALEYLGIDDSTPSPEGGLIGHDENGHVNGYLEETAFTALTARLPRPGAEESLKALKKAEDIYLANGITTAQDGLTRKAESQLLSAAADMRLLEIDTVEYIDMKYFKELYSSDNGTYRNHLRQGGYKIILDGSPQGRTAWMLTPYDDEEDYCGYPNYGLEELEEFVGAAMEEEVQILAHCNGDAAAEEFITAFEHVAARYDEDTRKRKLKKVRPVMIHCQLLRPYMSMRMKKLNMTASIFVSHIRHWGDVHIENFGFGRATMISPVQSCLDNGLLVTFHEDTPVLPPDMLEAMECATERITGNGVQLDESERCSRYDALLACTLNGAIQYGEEEMKGTLEVGKLADLVILSGNPLEDRLDGISVMETIKEGKTLYRRA